MSIIKIGNESHHLDYIQYQHPAFERRQHPLMPLEHIGKYPLYQHFCRFLQEAPIHVFHYNDDLSNRLHNDFIFITHSN